jgi:hypothetical protein
VADLQLDHHFQGNLRLFTYKNTPRFGTEMLGVVGYPGDRYITNEDGTQETGTEMYEDFQAVTYNLEERSNTEKMLKYHISTFGGALLLSIPGSSCVD